MALLPTVHQSVQNLIAQCAHRVAQSVVRTAASRRLIKTSRDEMAQTRKELERAQHSLAPGKS